MKSKTLFTVISLLSPLMLSAEVFADSNANPTSVETPVTANFTAPTNGGVNPTPPNPVTPNPDGSIPSTPGNKPLDPNTSFAIAYIPASFNFGSTEINSSGELNVSTPTANNKTFNVGVKNNRHTADGWTLTASLTGDLATNYGAQIKTKTTANSVNINNGNQGMIAAPAGTVTNTADYVINSSASPIMQQAKGKIQSGTFDLSLGDSVTLNIPDASTLQAGNYNGTVTWNLASVPM